MDREKIISEFGKWCDAMEDECPVICLNVLVLLKEQEQMYYKLEHDWRMCRELLKEQEAVKPRVSSVEQRCGNCNKVIEMDGWKSCPWCGKPILWESR